MVQQLLADALSNLHVHFSWFSKLHSYGNSVTIQLMSGCMGMAGWQHHPVSSRRYHFVVPAVNGLTSPEDPMRPPISHGELN